VSRRAWSGESCEALSSPPVPAQSPELEAEFVRVIAQAEGAAAPRWKRTSRGVTIGGLVLLGAVGVGGAAAAAGLVPWFESAPSHGVVTTTTGARCALTFGVKRHGEPGAPVSGAVRSKVTAAAEDYLKDFDVSSLSVTEATQAAVPRPTVDSEAGPALSVDEYEVQAVYEEVERRLHVALARQQLPSSSVSLSMASTCDGGDQ
jgi:hypothetical protein